METSRVLPGGRLLRYTMTERVVHWVAGISYVYLLLNGLSMWTPAMWWIAGLLGGGPLTRLTHPWVGLVFAVSMVMMYWMWRTDMRSTAADKAWRAQLSDYMTNRDEKLPPVGRYNAGQKMFFWGMLLCTALMLMTGLVLWFAELVPPNMAWMRHISIIVHPAAALTTIGLFIIHVYMGVVVVRGGFSQIVRGDVSKVWARSHHRLWADQVTGDASSRR